MNKKYMFLMIREKLDRVGSIFLHKSKCMTNFHWMSLFSPEIFTKAVLVSLIPGSNRPAVYYHNLVQMRMKAII